MKVLTLALAAALLAAAPAAASPAYGTGTFRGTVKSNVGKPRPHTRAVVKVRPGRARIARLGLAFHCTGESGLPERFTHSVSSPFAGVTRGAAGGGLRLVLHPEVAVGGVAYTADVEIFAGLRATTVTGTVDAYLHDSSGTVVCTDYGIFTARR